MEALNTDLLDPVVDDRMREYLSLIDTTVLKRKIRAYELRAKKKRRRKQIRKDLYDVLTPPNSNSFVLPCNTGSYPGGTRFFRCRVLTSVDQFSVMADAWEAPPIFAAPGRLNMEYEPLVYTAVGSEITAIYEARVKVGDIFSMTEYVAPLPVSVARIEALSLTPGLKDKEVRKLSMISQFLADAFTQKAGPEESHIYMAPEIIVKEFFDWPPHMTQGWGYPSLANPLGGYNACFRPDQARKSLNVLEVVISTCTRIEGEEVGFDRNRILRPIQGTSTLEVVWSPS